MKDRSFHRWEKLTRVGNACFQAADNVISLARYILDGGIVVAHCDAELLLEDRLRVSLGLR